MNEKVPVLKDVFENALNAFAAIPYKNRVEIADALIAYTKRINDLKADYKENWPYIEMQELLLWVKD
jgi:hypothetical protein